MFSELTTKISLKNLVHRFVCRWLKKGQSPPLRDATAVIKAQFFKYWLKVGWSRWAEAQGGRREGRKRWRLDERTRWDEKVDGKGRSSIIYDGRGRSLWIFSPIINAAYFTDKFLIIGSFKCLTKDHAFVYHSYRGIEHFLSVFIVEFCGVTSIRTLNSYFAHVGWKKKGLKDRIVDFSINHCRIFNIYFSDSICIQILEGEKIIIRGDRIMYSVIRSRSKFLFLNCIIRFTVNLNNRVYSIFWNYLVETFHFQYE